MVYSSIFTTNVDTTDYESIDNYLKSFEQRLCRKGGDSAITWMGIQVRWVPKPLKEGGNLKRGKTYGCIEYHNTQLWDINQSDSLKISRDEAIKWIIAPEELRQATIDVNSIKECHCCNKLGIGQEETEAWGKFRYSSGFNNICLDICDDFTARIVNKFV